MAGAGLDLGAGTIRLAALEATVEGYRLTAFAERPLPLAEGRLSGPALVGSEVRSICRRAGLKRPALCGALGANDVAFNSDATQLSDGQDWSPAVWQSLPDPDAPPQFNLVARPEAVDSWLATVRAARARHGRLDWDLLAAVEWLVHRAVEPPLDERILFALSRGTTTTWAALHQGQPLGAVVREPLAAAGLADEAGAVANLLGHDLLDFDQVLLSGDWEPDAVTLAEAADTLPRPVAVADPTAPLDVVSKETVGAADRFAGRLAVVLGLAASDLAKER